MSRVFIIGGTGFIGRRVAVALGDAGHSITAVGRSGFDLANDGVDTMVHLLEGYDAVVNTAGLVRGRGTNTLDAVHAAGVERLINACGRVGIVRLIHLSALGATSSGSTLYQVSKGRAEDALANSRLDYCVLRPSVVIGRGGASFAVLAALATLSFPPRLGPGTWQIQPVHVDDLAEAVVRLVALPEGLPRRVDAVGPVPLTTDQLTNCFRTWLGLNSTRFLPFPESVLGLVAALGERLMDGPMNREIVAMLKAGNVSDPAPFTKVLGHPPRPLAEALARHPATEADHRAARLFFLAPILRLSLSLLWLATGLLSLGLYPIAESHRLLEEAGLYGAPAEVALYGGALVDLILGALLLVRWRPVMVGALMLASMMAFTLIATTLPVVYWLHPFAPLLKNLPIAAATLAMMALEA